MTTASKCVLGTPEASAVIDAIRANPPCVLAGSGISLWEPTGLPTGGSFNWDTFNALFEGAFPRSSKEDKLLQTLFAGMPFEHLLEVCPAEDKIRTVLNELYSSRESNVAHQALAAGLASGRIFSIITTNYDCCLDAELDKLPSFSYLKAVTEAEALKAAGASDRCYFKIHGSAEPGYEDTPMFTLRHERFLPPGKRALLRRLIMGRPLLLIGYSGLDFELCPEIGSMPGLKIIWNNYCDAYPSPNAKKLLEDQSGVLLVGDMLKLISEWLTPINSCRSTGNPDAVRRRIEALFTGEEIAAWRVRVLNSMGAASFALRAIDVSIMMLDDSFAAIERSQANFHQGKYLTAAKGLAKVAAKKLIAGDIPKAVDVDLDASDCFRAYGAFIRASVCVLLAWLFDDGKSKAKRLLKKSLIIENLIQPGFIRRLSPIYQTGLFFLRRNLRACAAEALRTGNWIDLQQVSLIAGKAEIGLTEFHRDEYYSPPEAAQGYAHLGYYIPQMTCFLDDFRQESSVGLSGDLKKEWERHYRTCRRLGINSGSWKLIAIRELVLQRLRLPAKPNRKSFARYFAACEYSRLKRYLSRREVLH